MQRYIIPFPLRTLVAVFLLCPSLSGCYEKELSHPDGQEADQPLFLAYDSAYYQPRNMTDALYAGHFFDWVDQLAPSLMPVIKRSIQIMVNKRVPPMDSLFTEKLGPWQDDVRPWQVESYCFRYPSLSAKGEKVLLSGRVTFPRPTNRQLHHEVDRLCLKVHLALKTPAEAPTLSLGMQNLHAYYNEAVVEPDLEGYGSTEGRTHCGDSFDVLARQIMDCVMAARQVMQSHRVSLDKQGYTTCWSYSLGAPAALAFVKYYDQQATPTQRNALRLRSTYIGGGPYLLDELTHYIDSHPDYSAAIIAHLLKSLNALPDSDLGGYHHTDFYPDWILTTLHSLDGQEFTLYDLLVHQELGLELMADAVASPFNLLDRNLHPDMLTTEGHLNEEHPKTQVMMNLFRKLSAWQGWTPQTEVFMTHCPVDEMVPYAQAEKLGSELSSRSATFHFTQVKLPPLIEKLGMAHSLLSFWNVMQMACHQEPEEMIDIQ